MNGDFPTLADLTPTQRCQMRQAAMKIPVGTSDRVRMPMPRNGLAKVWTPWVSNVPPVDTVDLRLSRWHCKRCDQVFTWAAFEDEKPFALCSWCPIFDPEWAEPMAKTIANICQLAIEILRPRLASCARQARETADTYLKLKLVLAMHCMEWNP